MIVSAAAWFAGRFFEPDSVYRKSLVEANLVGRDPQERELRNRQVKEAILPVQAVLFKEEEMQTVIRDLRARNVSAELYPVLAEDGTLAGVLHADKLLIAVLHAGRRHRIRVEDLMEPPLGMISPGDTLLQAMLNMEHLKLRVLPVVRKDGHFIGILTKERLLERIHSAQQG
jgi:CIC family chloride channel protein